MNLIVNLLVLVISFSLVIPDRAIQVGKPLFKVNNKDLEHRGHRSSVFMVGFQQVFSHVEGILRDRNSRKNF